MIKEIPSVGVVAAFIALAPIMAVVIRLYYETVATILARPRGGFDALHKRVHLSFLIMMSITFTVLPYHLYTSHPYEFVSLLDDQVFQVMIFASSVSMYLMLHHLANERRGVIK